MRLGVHAQPPRSRSDLLQLLLPPVLFFVAVKLSLLFAVTEDSIVLLWMPNGILLATLLRYGFKRYGWFVVGILAAELAADYPTFSVAEAVAFAAINILEATAAYAILRRLRFNLEFATPADLGKFVMAGPLLAALGAAFAAGGVYEAFRGQETTYLNFVRTWWFSDGLGLLVVTPLALSVWPRTSLPSADSFDFRWYDVLGLGLALLLAAAFALSHDGVFRGITIRPLLLTPIAVYVAARWNLRATSCIVVAMALLVLYVVHNHQSPFGPLDIQDTALWAQEHLLTMSLMAVGLNALLSQHRASQRELEGRVRARTLELSDANTKLEKLALTDALTELPNRRALFAVLNAEISRQQRLRHGLAVIMFDVDHFKRVNDVYGHAAGDAVLQHVARTALQVIRDMDTLARYGGEEFVLLAPEIDETNAIALAERVRAALATNEASFEQHRLRVTASFGIAMLGPTDADEEALVRRADAALYEAKSAGRNRVVVQRPTAEGKVRAV